MWLPSSCVSEESLSSVGMSSLSLKSSEGEGTGPPGPLASLFFSSTTSGTASSSPSGKQSAYSSAGRSNWEKGENRKSLNNVSLLMLSSKCPRVFPAPLHLTFAFCCVHVCVCYLTVFIMQLTVIGVSLLAGMGMVLLGMTFLCNRGGLPSGLASVLFLDKLSLLISFSSLGISSLNLKVPGNSKTEIYCTHFYTSIFYPAFRFL